MKSLIQTIAAFALLSVSAFGAVREESAVTYFRSNTYFDARAYSQSTNPPATNEFVTAAYVNGNTGTVQMSVLSNWYFTANTTNGLRLKIVQSENNATYPFSVDSSGGDATRINGQGISSTFGDSIIFEEDLIEFDGVLNILPGLMVNYSNLVFSESATYTATVAKAASAVQPADTNGWVVSSHSGLATEAQAGQIATNVASGYLPLAGHNGPVVLGTRTRGYAASTNLGDYGFAAGFGTSAGNYGFAAGASTSAGYAGFAAGDDTSAGNYGFAAGDNASAGEYGFAAGDGTSAGNYGFAAGDNTSAGNYGFAAGVGTSAGNAGFAAGFGTSAGNYGFAAGRAAKGADGSFVFADSNSASFTRTNLPNSFSVRASGGTYFNTPELVVTGAVTATKFCLRTDNSAWLQSDGTNLFFISTVSPGFTNALTTNTP